MFLLSEEVVIVLFGERWRAIIPVLSILSLGVFFRTTYKCSDVLIRSQGRVYNYAAGQAWYTLVIVGGSFIGATLYGVAGVAYAVVIGVAVNYVVMTRLAASLVRASFRDVVESHLPGMWVSAWMWGALSVTLPYIRGSGATPFVILVSATCLGVTIAFVAFLVARPVLGASFAQDLVRKALLRRVPTVV
jgi:PST family polysaccharide transporter